MKRTLSAVVIIACLTVGTAHAGSLSDPVVEPEVVMVDAAQTAGHPEMILAALAVMAIILGSSL